MPTMRSARLPRAERLFRRGCGFTEHSRIAASAVVSGTPGVGMLASSGRWLAQRFSPDQRRTAGRNNRRGRDRRGDLFYRPQRRRSRASRHVCRRRRIPVTGRLKGYPLAVHRAAPPSAWSSPKWPIKLGAGGPASIWCGNDLGLMDTPRPSSHPARMWPGTFGLAARAHTGPFRPPTLMDGCGGFPDRLVWVSRIPTSDRVTLGLGWYH